MILGYDRQKQYQKELAFDDLGNIGLICSTDEGVEYYFAIKTVMGVASIIKFGPVIPDFPGVTDGFAVFYRKLPFKEPIILKEINTFINDPKKKITDIEEVPPVQIIDSLPDKSLYFESEAD